MRLKRASQGVQSRSDPGVDRVDEAQMRLKLDEEMRDSNEYSVDRVDEAQMRLKRNQALGLAKENPGG